MTRLARHPFTLQAPDAGEVAAAVAEHGVAHLPGLLDDDDLAELQESCRTMIRCPPDYVERMEYSTGAGLRTPRARLADEFPHVVDTFDRPWVRAVARSFFGTEPYLFNEDVIVVRDLVDTRHAAHLPHYDRMPNLKFFVYLTDTVEQTGAFRCLPGSQTYAKKTQRENRARGVLPAQMDTRELPEELREGANAVEGPAGTVLVIDSDVVHRAGTVRHGERLAVRSRSFAPTYLSRWG